MSDFYQGQRHACTLPLFFNMWLWLVKDYPPPPIHLWLLYWTSSCLILAGRLISLFVPYRWCFRVISADYAVQQLIFHYLLHSLINTHQVKYPPFVNWLLYLYCVWLMSMFNGYRLLKIPFPNECLCRGSLFLPHSQALPWFRAYYHLCLTPRWKAREECSQWHFLSQRAKTLCVKMCIIAFFIWDFEST